MFIVIFPYLPGSESPVFQGVSVFLGIIFSLGSSSVISNMVAGLVMTYMRPFQIGDRIKIGDIIGYVIEKTPFVTRIKTPKQEYITVPNSKRAWTIFMFLINSMHFLMILMSSPEYIQNCIRIFKMGLMNQE